MQLRLISSIIVLLFFVSSAFGQAVITTLAGTDWLFPGDGLPAAKAPLGGSFGLDVAIGPKGSYLIADPDNLMVMRVDSDGIIHVLAGNGILGTSGDGGLAVNASLDYPASVAADAAGNVYIAEFDGRVRRVTPDGIITTIAGNGFNGYSGDGGQATRAQLNQPDGVAVDSAGNVYISDYQNNRIRKVTTDGFISTLAGTGQEGYGGDGGMATAAVLDKPTRIAVDAGGNVYFVESRNDRVRRITPDGRISTVAGGGQTHGSGVPATQVFMIPVALAVDAAGSIYIADYSSSSIRKVDPSGIISWVAGNGQYSFSGDKGSAMSAALNFPVGGLAVDAQGNLLLADNENRRIRKISGGTIDTVAGNGLFRFAGNDGPAASASIFLPTGITVDIFGNIYFTEQTLNRVRRITPDGTLSVVAGNGVQGYSGDNGPATSAALSFPAFLTSDVAGNVYFSDALSSVIRRIDTQGIIITVAGNGSIGFSGDSGPAVKAQLSVPYGIDLDQEGFLYIADRDNNRLRVVNPAGDIFTLAGTGTAGFAGDNGSSFTAQLNAPTGLKINAARTGREALYFSDSTNQRVRTVFPNAAGGFTILTVAGNGRQGYAGDGGQAINASLNSPEGLGFDRDGNLYIADTGNHVVRRVARDGTISTVAGNGFAGFGGDGGLATQALLGLPYDIAFDAAGNLLIADLGDNRIREVLTAAPSVQANPTSLAFTAPSGSTPLDQDVAVMGAIPGIPFSASSSASWLKLSPAAGSTPATIRVTADPAGISPGSYQGAVTISTPYANPTSETVSVAFTVTAAGAPSLAVKPGFLKYALVRQSAAVTSSLAVSNAGGGSLNVSVATAVNVGSWLKAKESSIGVGPFGTTTVSVTADPAGLPPGAYSGTVTLSSASPAQSVTVPVTMTVTDVLQTILIPQTGLTFLVVEGGGAPPPQDFSILNTGRGQMSWTTQVSTLSGGPWLSVFPASGVSDASSPIVPQIRVNVNPQGLNAGVYYGSVKVSAPNADNTPQFVSVVMNVLKPGSNVGPLVLPSGLIFVASAGGESPGSQTVLVQNVSGAPVTFRSGRTTTDGANWFTTLPPSAAVTIAEPVRIVVQPVINGLAPGLYRGTLTLSFSDGSIRNVALVLVITPAASGSSASKSVRAAGAGCPSTLAPVFTQLSEGANVPAAYPSQVAVKVTDDCGQPLTGGSVMVTFSNGDPALHLDSLKDGSWAATWIPQNQSAKSTVVTAVAQDTARSLTGKAQVKVGFQVFDAPPVIGAGAVVNAASYAADAPLAPGSLVSIFGSKLAQGQMAATTLPLPVQLAGSAVSLAALEVPLLYASDGQVNAIIPYGIHVNAGQQLLVARGSSLSVAQTVTMAAAAPGIFSRDASGTGQGIIVDTTNSIIDPAHAAKAGDAIVIYCTGLGEVNPTVQAGSPASLTKLSFTVNPVSVTVGGLPATVLFSGLTPGFVGLYQVNAVIPAGVATGDRVNVVITAAGQISRPVTIAIH